MRIWPIWFIVFLMYQFHHCVWTIKLHVKVKYSEKINKAINCKYVIQNIRIAKVIIETV